MSRIKGKPLKLPMRFRRFNPMGYTHGVINHQGIRHPGYDLNDGPNPWADLNQEMFAPGDGLVVFAGKSAGWGNLLVIYLADKYEIDGVKEFIGVRIGHAEKMLVKAGDRVKAGQLVALCGPSNIAGMAPHCHYDIFRRSVLEELGAEFVQRYGQREADRVQMPFAYWDSVARKRDNFKRLYLDPADFHPEIEALGY